MRGEAGVPAVAHLAGAAVALSLLLTGCQEVEEEGHAVYQPSTVSEVEGSAAKQVTFTARGARAVELALATARASGPFVTVPYAALLYDGEGASWVVTSPRELTFLRVPVSVARVTGDLVLLDSGLAAGTRVVTVGAAEVYGAELGIGGGH